MAEKNSLELPKYARLVAGEGESACSMKIAFDESEIKRLAKFGWRVQKTFFKPMTDRQTAEAAEYGLKISAATGNFFHLVLTLPPDTPKKEALERIRAYRRQTRVFGKLSFEAEPEINGKNV